jgi:hypothetical protein
MLPSRKPNYASQLDYSWNDLKLKAEYAMQQARVFPRNTPGAVLITSKGYDVFCCPTRSISPSPQWPLPLSPGWLFGVVTALTPTAPSPPRSDTLKSRLPSSARADSPTPPPFVLSP